LGVEGRDELVVLPLGVVVVAEVDFDLASGLPGRGRRSGSGRGRGGGGLGGRSGRFGLGGLGGLGWLSLPRRRGGGGGGSGGRRAAAGRQNDRDGRASGQRQEMSSGERAAVHSVPP